jgi:inorganic pyrophosphatase
MEEKLIIFVEIPKGSRNKYELDEKTGHLFLDRVLYGEEVFPFDYGSVEETLGEDGDPLDAVLLVTNPTFPGCRVQARVLGYLEMEDEAGIDSKLLCAPLKKVDHRLANIEDVTNLPEKIKEEIRYFFENYKKLEPGKWVKVKDFKSKEEAERIIKEAKERYNNKK